MENKKTTQVPSGFKSFGLNLCLTAPRLIKNILTKHKALKRSSVNLFLHSLLHGLNLFQGNLGLCIKSWA